MLFKFVYYKFNFFEISYYPIFTQSTRNPAAHITLKSSGRL